MRTAFFATRQHYFDLYVDVLMHLGDQQPGSNAQIRALEVNERRRARGFLDLLTESRKRSPSNVESSLPPPDRELADEIDAVEWKLLEAQEKSRGQEKEIAALEKQRRELWRRRDEARAAAGTESRSLSKLTRLEPLDLQQIRSQVLDKNSVLLVYSLGEERSFLWLIPHDGEVITRVLPARSLLEDAAKVAYASWSRTRHRGNAGNHSEEYLSRELLAPVMDRLTTRRLLIVADGALEYLPFAALPDPRTLAASGSEGRTGKPPQPLVRNHVIVHLPSPSVLAFLRQEIADRHPAMFKIAVIADPIFESSDPRLNLSLPAGEASRFPGLTSSPLERSESDLGLGGFERLPYTEVEAAVIRDLVAARQRFEALGFAATRRLVLNGKLSRYRVLHFATHGLLNSKNPELSGLVLCLVDEQGRPQNGFLRAHEIASLHLPAELAVLSACETGLGSEVRGEGLVGLTRSFMAAGVPRVLVSLWKVSDQGTSELMKRVYRGMFKKHLAPASALRCAQLSMLEDPEWSSPYYWGPFIFQGEWRLGSAALGDGVEKQVAGGQGNVNPDDDLPPPSQGGPVGCPALDDATFQAEKEK